MPIGVPISDGQHGEDQAADDRIEQPAGGPGRRRHLGEDASESPLTPFHSSTPRITTSQPSPNTVGADRTATIAMPLRRRRAAYEPCSWRYPIRRSMRISM